MVINNLNSILSFISKKNTYLMHDNISFVFYLIDYGKAIIIIWGFNVQRLSYLFILWLEEFK